MPENRDIAALREFDDAKGKYLDVHAWYFTPDSASVILSTLQSVGLSPLRVRQALPGTARHQ